ncbi:MAG: response regulator [Spirochaetaceae bacterium]|jgi:two-component system response regulator YesN|nr:response regulator [Spirochaetaceae bacterium]
MFKAIVADDEDIIRKGIVSFIKQEKSIEVVAHASDGVEALTLAKKYLPDLIFVDINMPLMNGLELIEKLNELEKEILVIVVTGYSDFTYAQKALRLGVFDYFLKPIMEKPFFSILEKAKKYLEEQRSLNDIYSQLKETSDYAVERSLNLLSLGLIGEEHCREKLLRLNLEKNQNLVLLIISPGRFIIPDPDDIEIPHLIKKTAGEYFKNGSFFISFVNVNDYIICLTEKRYDESIKNFENSLGFSVDIIEVDLDDLKNLPVIYVKTLKEIQARTQYSRQVQLSLDFIKENYSNPGLTLSMISDASNASPGHLGRLCKEEIHRTPMDYLSHYRVKMASKLLSDKTLRIYDVAEKAGFTSQHYFCHSFKKITGQAPREYRNSMENK